VPPGYKRKGAGASSSVLFWFNRYCFD
jgi:hypothetical protein